MPQIQGLGDRWGAETSPSGFELEYAAAADTIAPGIVDYARQIAQAGETLINAISRARLTLDMTDQQRALLQVQLTRAQQGLPPIPAAPAPAVPTWVWVAGLALLGVLLLRSGNDSRRG